MPVSLCAHVFAFVCKHVHLPLHGLCAGEYVSAPHPCAVLTCWHVPGCLQASLWPVSGLYAGEGNTSDLLTIPRIIHCDLRGPSFLVLKLGPLNIPQAKVAETLSHTFSLNPLEEKKTGMRKCLAVCWGGFSIVTLHPLPSPRYHITDEVG